MFKETEHVNRRARGHGGPQYFLHMCEYAKVHKKKFFTFVTRKTPETDIRNVLRLYVSCRNKRDF